MRRSEQNRVRVNCLDNKLTGSKRGIRGLMKSPGFDDVRQEVAHAIYLQSDKVCDLAGRASPVDYQFDPVHTTKTSVMGAINGPAPILPARSNTAAARSAAV